MASSKEVCRHAILSLIVFFVVPAWAQDWEKEWNGVLAGAKKEGMVGVMSSAGGSDNRRGLTEPFEKKYGIRVEYFSSSGSAMVNRIKSERAAGLSQWDIFIGGTSTPLTGLKPGGMLAPVEPAFILPEVKDGKYWLGGKPDFADKEGTVLVMLAYSKSIIHVNTAMVKPEELGSVKDLLNPKWKGKILAADPRGPGAGQTAFNFILAHKDLGPEFIRQLAKQELHLLRDDRQAAEWIATGKYPILIGGSDTDIEPFMKQNLPIRLIDPRTLKEGGYLSVGPGGISLLSSAPHPNAAKVYLNWLLSREGQTAFVKSNGAQSRRLDTPIPPEPWKFRPDLGYWVSYGEDAIFSIQNRLRPLLKEVFGE
jgi:iron(III) transport system substrate-binding protein